jgi:hypothetical protein
MLKSVTSIWQQGKQHCLRAYNITVATATICSKAFFSVANQAKKLAVNTVDFSLKKIVEFKSDISSNPKEFKIACGAGLAAGIISKSAFLTTSVLLKIGNEALKFSVKNNAYLSFLFIFGYIFNKLKKSHPDESKKEYYTPELIKDLVETKTKEMKLAIRKNPKNEQLQQEKDQLKSDIMEVLGKKANPQILETQNDDTEQSELVEEIKPLETQVLG